MNLYWDAVEVVPKEAWGWGWTSKEISRSELYSQKAKRISLVCRNVENI